MTFLRSVTTFHRGCAKIKTRMRSDSVNLYQAKIIFHAIFHARLLLSIAKFSEDILNHGWAITMQRHSAQRFWPSTLTLTSEKLAVTVVQMLNTCAKFHVNWICQGQKNVQLFMVNPSQKYGVSPAIRDHTVLPATRHKWTHPTLTPASNMVIYLPRSLEGWKAELTYCYPAMHRPGVELAIFRSRGRHPNHYTTEPSEWA